MGVKMDIRYLICVGYGYVGQNGVFDWSETTYQKKKKKVDRSDYGWWLGLQFNFMALFGRLHCTFR